MTGLQYATALKEALQGKSTAEQKKMTTYFLERVTERGHEKLLPSVVAHLERLGPPTSDEFLVVGSKKDVVQARKEAKTKVGAIVNPDLIGGWQHYKDGVLTDTSYKRSLIELYRNITK